MSNLANHTSADDMRSSLKLINPKSSEEIRKYLEYLNESLNDEVKNRNRASVIKMLRTKINQIKKQKPERV